MTLLQNWLGLSSAVKLQLSIFQQNQLSALHTAVLSPLELCVSFYKSLYFTSQILNSCILTK